MKSLEIKKRLLGDEHEEVSYSLGMLAADYFFEEDNEKAFELLE
jgi:tetratricopeptide (TPR) repeat protein